LATLVDALITVGIIVFVLLVAWSRFEHKEIMDVIGEIQEKLKEKQE